MHRVRLNRNQPTATAVYRAVRGVSVRTPRVPGSHPLLKLSDVFVVRHAGSSTRLATARHRLAPGRVAHDEARVLLLNGPRRRKAARARHYESVRPLHYSATHPLPTWVPLCCPGESRGNKTTKLFSKHRHYLNRSASISGIPPKADIGTQPRDVRFVPKADIKDHSVRQARFLKSVSVPRDIFRPSKRGKIHGSRQRRCRIQLANARNSFFCFCHFSGKRVACHGNS